MFRCQLSSVEKKIISCFCLVWYEFPRKKIARKFIAMEKKIVESEMKSGKLFNKCKKRLSIVFLYMMVFIGLSDRWQENAFCRCYFSFSSSLLRKFGNFTSNFGGSASQLERSRCWDTEDYWGAYTPCQYSQLTPILFNSQFSHIRCVLYSIWKPQTMFWLR